MVVLGVDTSGSGASLAVAVGGEIRGCLRPAGANPSRALLAGISRLLADAGVVAAQLDGLAVAVGPGSFTGLRIGLATVKGLAWAWNKPVAAVSTLEALARAVVDRGALLVPVLDARRGQVYTARFTALAGAVTRCDADRAVDPAEAFAVAGAGAVFCGDGVRRYRALAQQLVAADAVLVEEDLDLAAQVALAGTALLGRGEGGDAVHLNAQYVRQSDAQVHVARPVR